MILMVVTSVAFATSTSAGIEVPAQGGAWTGPAETGTLGIANTPAAAISTAPEIALDFGVMRSHQNTQLDAWEGPVDHGWGTSPVPNLMFTVPWKEKVALGGVFTVPYARGGGLETPDGPERFHSVSGGIRLLEEDAVLSVQPIKGLTVGGMLRVGEFTFSGAHAIDSATTINGILGPDEANPAPYGDPLLEGMQSVSGVHGTMVSWGVGVRYRRQGPPEGLGADVWFTPPAPVHGVGGTVDVQPSRDLNLIIGSDLSIVFTFPMRFGGALDIPMGDWRFVPEAQFMGWRQSGQPTKTLGDLDIRSEDPLMQSILESYGITEAEFLDSSAGTSSSDSHWNNTVNLGLAIHRSLGERWEVLAAGFYQPSVVDDSYANPGNLDFAINELRLGGAFQPLQSVRLLLAAEDFFPRHRTITDSELSLDNDAATEPVSPSGNGNYDLDLYRFGLTVLISL